MDRSVLHCIHWRVMHQTGVPGVLTFIHKYNVALKPLSVHSLLSFAFESWTSFHWFRWCYFALIKKCSELLFLHHAHSVKCCLFGGCLFFITINLELNIRNFLRNFYKNLSLNNSQFVQVIDSKYFYIVHGISEIDVCI